MSLVFGGGMRSRVLFIFYIVRLSVFTGYMDNSETNGRKCLNFRQKGY